MRKNKRKLLRSMADRNGPQSSHSDESIGPCPTQLANYEWRPIQIGQSMYNVKSDQHRPTSEPSHRLPTLDQVQSPSIGPIDSRCHRQTCRRTIQCRLTPLWLTTAMVLLLALTPWPYITAVHGLTEIGTVSGDRVDIPCNTSTWAEDEVSLVLWFRGDTGVPIYRVDARSVPLAKSTHTTAEELRKRFFFDINVKPPVLRINPVLPSDAAEYRCRVDFRQSRTQNVLVALNVTVPPKELLIMDVEGQKLESVIGPYDENSNVLLICEAEGGKPSPSVNWYSGSRLLDSSFTTGPHGLVRNELNIRNLNRSDFMSILTCRASNNNVTEPISSTVILDMNLRPLDVKILTKSTPTTPSSASSSQIKSSSSSSAVTSIASPSTIILSGGSKAEFQCRTIGSRPAAQISWWLGSERLSSNVRDSVNEDGNATISSITFVPGVEDNGKMLTCRADNLPMPHTALKDERLLNVHFAPQLRISFGANIGRDNIREGSDVYLECRVRANPPVKEVVWLHDGRPLHGSLTGDVNAADASRSTIIMTNQSLVIQKVHRTHRGRYQCVAFNDQGETVSDPLHLKVNFAPVCTKAQKHQYGVSRNEQIRIRCEVDAEPSNGLTFRWTLNTSGSETSVEWASFTVNATTSIATYRPENSLDYGTLACVAQNSIGGQSEPCIYNVVPAGRPDPVRSCGITNHSMSTLLVECLPGDDGGLRQHFSLEVYIATTQRLHSNHSSSQPNFIVSSLTPGTQYSLVMYASNAKGRSHTVSLSAVTLSPPEKHIARGSIEQIVVHPFLAILIGSVATIVVIIILLVLIVRGRHARYRAQNHRNSNGRNGGSDSATALTSNGELKMKKIKMNGNATNNKGISNGKSKPSNGSDNNGKSSGPNVANMPNGECDAMRQLDSHYNNNNQKESPLRGGKEQGLTEKEMMANQAENVCYVGAIRHPNQDMASPIDHQREMNQMLLHSSQVMSDGSNLALISPSQLSVKCDTSLVLGSRPTSTGDGSQHSTSSSSATTAPISDLIGPNGSLYGPNESGLMHHSSCTVKPMSPSHQTITRTTQNGMPRHLVDLSSGSTCCSSSTSSSPHTLMQGPPPVPSLPQSITQGVMLFAPSELATVETVSSNSPSHFASHQYSTHQYHPYLNSHTSNTLPRHYDGNMSLSTASPLKLYSQDQIMHTSAIYEDQYTPVIVNSLEQAYPHHLTSVHQQATPILYYNSPSPIPSMVDASIDAKIHYHQHLKSSNTSQTLPRRCSVGPLEGPQPNNDGLYVSFTKAPKNAAQAKNYSGSALLKTNQQAVHVDCVEGSGTMEPLLSANESNSSGSSTSANCDQANLSSSLRPHEICLTSSPRKGATAV